MTHDHHLKAETLKKISSAMDDARHAAFVNVLVDDLDALILCARDFRDQADEIALLKSAVASGKEREATLELQLIDQKTVIDQAAADVAEARRLEREAEKRADDLEAKYADTFALNQQQADTIDAQRVTIETQTTKIAEQAAEIDVLLASE